MFRLELFCYSRSRKHCQETCELLIISSRVFALFSFLKRSKLQALIFLEGLPLFFNRIEGQTSNIICKSYHNQVEGKFLNFVRMTDHKFLHSVKQGTELAKTDSYRYFIVHLHHSCCFIQRTFMQKIEHIPGWQKCVLFVSLFIIHYSCVLCEECFTHMIEDVHCQSQPSQSAVGRCGQKC